MTTSIKSTPTTTVTAVAVIEPVEVPRDSVALLATAVSTLDGVGTSTDKLTVALKSLTIERYMIRAERHVVTAPNGNRVVKGDSATLKDITGMLWLDACGSIVPVTVKERKAGQRSLGQYISNIHKVAINIDNGGTSKLADSATMEQARKVIGESKAKAKANLANGEQALSDASDILAFDQWLETCPAELKMSYAHVIHSLRNDGAPHLHAFALVVTVPANVNHSDKY